MSTIIIGYMYLLFLPFKSKLFYKSFFFFDVSWHNRNSGDFSFVTPPFVASKSLTKKANG